MKKKANFLIWSCGVILEGGAENLKEAREYVARCKREKLIPYPEYLTIEDCEGHVYPLADKC